MGLGSMYCLLLATLVHLASCSVLPSYNPPTTASSRTLDIQGLTDTHAVPPFRSAWSFTNAAPNKTFDETEQEYRGLEGFKQPDCDGAKYGRGLQTESCRDALVMIPQDKRQLIFGARNRGRGWNVNLPYRFSSRLLPFALPPAYRWLC